MNDEQWRERGLHVCNRKLDFIINLILCVTGTGLGYNKSIERHLIIHRLNWIFAFVLNGT